jgi:23S rRNA (uracil1939-C5)-methyltransferase
VRLRIERLVPGGAGMAHLADGRVAFVAGAFPRDLVEAHTISSRRSHVEVTRWDLVEPSPERVEPDCAYADTCGGCDWMRLGPAYQVEHKARILRDALERIGGLAHLPEPFVVHGCGQALGYRSRLRLHIEGGRLGLYGRGTHELVEIERCVVCTEELSGGLRELRGIVARHGRESAHVREAELRHAPGSERLALRLFLRDSARGGRRVRGLLEALAARFSLAGPGAAGGQHQRWPLPGGVELMVPPAAFVQVNWAANTALVATLLERVDEVGIRRFCDVYCGAGNFALPLFARGIEGVGVDASVEAIAAAREAAGLSGLAKARFASGDAATVTQRLIAAGERFDLVILDPPRSGARGVSRLVTSLEPRHVAMCSCDPPTLARDLRELGAAGYVLTHLSGFDMFPQTHHVETLAWLERRGT